MAILGDFPHESLSFASCNCLRALARPFFLCLCLYFAQANSVSILCLETGLPNLCNSSIDRCLQEHSCSYVQVRILIRNSAKKRKCFASGCVALCSSTNVAVVVAVDVGGGGAAAVQAAAVPADAWAGHTEPMPLLQHRCALWWLPLPSRKRKQSTCDSGQNKRNCHYTSNMKLHVTQQVQVYHNSAAVQCVHTNDTSAAGRGESMERREIREGGLIGERARAQRASKILRTAMQLCFSRQAKEFYGLQPVSHATRPT